MTTHELSDWSARHLGASIDELLFSTRHVSMVYEARVGSVRGLLRVWMRQTDTHFASIRATIAGAAQRRTPSIQAGTSTRTSSPS